MNGLDGLAAIRQRRPDLILLDMHLPDIDGLELLRHLKDDDDLGSIPVVVVSADATAAHIEAALTAGAAHYLTKPVNVASFLAIAGRAAGRHGHAFRLSSLKVSSRYRLSLIVLICTIQMRCTDRRSALSTREC